MYFNISAEFTECKLYNKDMGKFVWALLYVGITGNETADGPLNKANFMFYACMDSLQK